MPDEQVHTVVLGAGVSGLVAARIALRRGAANVLVVDEYDRVGGNHINCDFGQFTFDIGTLIFQDDSPFMTYFPELLPLYHEVQWQISRVTPDNAVRDYPISIKEEVFGIGMAGMARVFTSILRGRLRSRRFANADEYARYWIGTALYQRSGLAHYIRRFYGVPASAIDPVFAQSRMGWLAEGGSVRKQVARLMGRRQAWQASRSFVRPRAGFAPLYAAARQALEAANARFRLGEALRSVERDRGLFRVVTAGSAVTCRQLISTIPVGRAYALCGLGVPAPLPYSKLVSLFFSFDGERGFESNILYNFSADGEWKRLTMFSDFYGPADSRQFFGVEVTAPGHGPVDGDAIAARFRADIDAKRLFRGVLALEGWHELDHAYPVYLHGANQRARGMIEALRSYGVVSLGRQGGFDYLPTARQVTLAVEASLGVTR